MMSQNDASAARATESKIGGTAFILGGLLITVLTFIVERWSESVAIGLVLGCLLLVIGVRWGIPRMAQMHVETGGTVAMAGTGAHSRRISKVILVSLLSTVVAMTGIAFVAYVIQKIGTAADAGFSLAPVILLVGAATMIYTGLLQLATPRQKGSDRR